MWLTKDTTGGLDRIQGSWFLVLSKKEVEHNPLASSLHQNKADRLIQHVKTKIISQRSMMSTAYDLSTSPERECIDQKLKTQKSSTMQDNLSILPTYKGILCQEELHMCEQAKEAHSLEIIHK